MKSTRSIQILLVEDDELFRLGLRVRLESESGIAISAEAETGMTAIEMTDTHSIDLVLLDIGLPDISGVETCRRIKAKYPNLPVLILTSHSQPELITELVNAGANGYCLKGIGAELLILAIQSVVAGASWWDNTATKIIRDKFDPTSPPTDIPSPPPAEKLTSREREILSLIAAGKSNPEIAQCLYITHGTVRVHVHGILQKLGVRDRTQAVLFAIQHHLIPQGGSAIES
jgi:two-component system, NarL family, response regulator